MSKKQTNKLICGNCGHEFQEMEALGNYWYRCTYCGYTSPCFLTKAEAAKFILFNMTQVKQTGTAVCRGGSDD